MSSASRGLAPREGLECFVDEDGPYGLLAQPRRGPQVGKSGDPRSRNADSSPRAQGALGLGFAAKPRPSSEHRGPQKPAASVDAWWMIGCGHLCFPMLPRQLHDLTSPCDMQGKPSLPAIVGDAGWPSLAINGEGAEPPLPISSSLACFFFLAPLLAVPPMAP